MLRVGLVLSVQLCAVLLLVFNTASARELEVIGAGFGRSGTMSLKLALEDLGFKTYHMTEIIDNHQDHADVWWQVAQAKKEGKPTAPLLHELFNNSEYSAAVDFPACLYWKELLEAFPTAKLILTERQPETWYESAFETIFQHHKRWQINAIGLVVPFFGNFAAWIQHVAYDIGFGLGIDPSHAANREVVVRRYIEHGRSVRDFAAQDKNTRFKQLDYKKDSMQSLCDFVGATHCPAQTFPHANDRIAFYNNFLLPLSMGVIIAFLSPVWLSFLSYFAYRSYVAKSSQEVANKID